MHNFLNCNCLGQSRSWSMVLGLACALVPAFLLSFLLAFLFSSGVAVAQTASTNTDKSAQILSTDLDHYIYFAGPDDMQKAEIEASKQQLVPWTEADKLALRATLAGIFQKTPWLIAGSGWHHKVALGRISSTRSTQVFRGATPYAISGPGYIIFTDTYFAAKNQSHALVHELVHVADSGNKIAYSKEWIDFAQSKICKLRLREQLLSQKGWLWYNGEVLSKNIWPSLYGAENLKEALAEYYTAYYEGSDFIIDNRFKARIVPHLTSPTVAELTWRDTATQALIQLKCQNYDDARASFLQAQQMDPSPPSLDYYLSECYMNGRDGMAAAFQSICRAVDKSDELNIAIDEPMVHSALLSKTDLLRKEGQYDKAIAVANRVLSYNLYDEDARFLRGACERQDGSRGQALQDTYFSKGCFGFVFSPLMGIEADPVIARLAVDEIVKLDKSGEGLWGRAQFFEQCAHSSSSQDDKAKFNALALADYQSSIEKDSTHKVDGLLRCADLYFKLRQLDKAKQYCEQALLLHTDGLAPRIMQVKIKEAGDSKSVQKEFWEISRLMPEGQQRAELHDYNYLEPPSPLFDSLEWKNAF